MQETVICQSTSVKASFYSILPLTEQSEHRRLFPASSYLSFLHERKRRTVDRATSSQGATDTRFRNSGRRRPFGWSKLSGVTTTHPLHVLSDITLLIRFHNTQIHNNYNNCSIFYVISILYGCELGHKKEKKTFAWNQTLAVQPAASDSTARVNPAQYYIPKTLRIFYLYSILNLYKIKLTYV